MIQLNQIIGFKSFNEMLSILPDDNEANDKLLIKTIRWDKTRIDFSEI